MKTLVDLPASLLQARNFVGGSWSAGTGPTRQVLSPYTGQVLGAVSYATEEEVRGVVEAAQRAAEHWRRVPIKERTALLLSVRNLLLRELKGLAHSAARECGKTVAEARAEILKGIEVLEFACSVQNGDLGGALEVSRGVTCEYRREALGVTVGITPFNFPAMVPMWMIPIAIAMGNSFILKPSDKVPFTPCLLAELLSEAGLPPGVFSVVHGGKDVVDRLVTDPTVEAVAFVGSSVVARSVYSAATLQGKRALCLGGAKNHLIVAPDADPSVTIDGVVSSFTGCAGQRCMAASVMVAVGDAERIIPEIVAAAGRIKIGEQMGALIDAASLERLHAAIARAETAGARVLLDGRKVSPPSGYELGFWLGPTIIGDADSSMECVQLELFGPVLTIVKVATLDEALALEARSPFGNATSVFTSNGGVARYVAEKASSGMIGINVGVPVPREPFSFGGTKESRFGSGDITGAGGIEFWSNRKKITAKWALQTDKNWMS
jgi:malonate-semialdehyde dehydrogenase (acetylating)/methylmalonate-semialdehyde dehydrogenase